MTRRSDTIIVVGLQDGPDAGSGPAILAAAEGFRRVGVALAPFEGGAHRPGLCDRVVSLPALPEAQEPLIDALVALAAEEEAPVFLPGEPRIAARLIRGRARLLSVGARVPLVSAEVFTRFARDPGRGLGAKGAPPCLPATRISGTTTIAELATVVHPALYVAADGRRALARDVFEGFRHASRFADDDLPVQGFGGVTAPLVEWAAVAARDGALLASAALRALSVDERERIWVGVTIASPGLALLGRAALAASGFDGAVVVSARFVEGRFVLQDLRPGLPHWVEAARAAGADLVSAAAELGGGRARADAATASAGVLFSQTAEDLVVDAVEPVRLARGTRP